LPITTSALALDTISYGCLAVLSCRLAQRTGGWVGMGVCLAWIVLFIPLLIRSAGMETPLYAAGVVAAFLLWQAGHTRPALVVAGLLSLIRGDGLLVFAVLFGSLLVTRKVKPFMLTIALALTPLLAWELFSFWQFHSFLPEGYVAKHAQVANVSGKFDLSTLRSLVWPSAWWLLPSAIAGVFISRGIPAIRLFGIWSLIYTMFYAFLASVPAQPWYGLPIWWTVPVLVAAGMGSLRVKALRMRDPFIGWTSLACLLFALLGLWTGGRTLTQALAAPGQVANEHRAAATYLSRSKPGAVATMEVGTIGYYSRHPVIDMLGLVSPEVIPHLSKQDYLWIVKKKRPRFVYFWVVRPNHACNWAPACRVWDDSWFLRHYHVIRTWPTDSVDFDYGLMTYRG
jgi:hypothetical protein